MAELGGGGVDGVDDWDFAASIVRSAAGSIDPLPVLTRGLDCSLEEDEFVFWLK